MRILYRKVKPYLIDLVFVGLYLWFAYYFFVNSNTVNLFFFAWSLILLFFKVSFIILKIRNSRTW